jgi:hypothetical protein
MEKNSHLKDLQALGPLEVFRADLQEEGSFDDAVAGCDYVFLVAAPVNLKTENPEVKISRHATVRLSSESIISSWLSLTVGLWWLSSESISCNTTVRLSSVRIISPFV